MVDPFTEGLRVGHVLVDPHDRTVTDAEGTHTLPVGCMKLLMALARHPGSPVHIDDLIEELNCDRHAIDSKVGTLREIFEDTGSNARFIVQDNDSVTLIAPVRAAPGPAADNTGKTGSVSIWKQLQRRKVIRVAAAYAVLAWVAIQVADTVLPRLGAPAWTITLTIAVAILGLPIAVVVAWLFEITAIGTLRDQRRKPAPLTLKQKVTDLLLLGCVAIGATYFSLNVMTDVVEESRRASDDIHSFEKEAAPNSVAVLPFLLLGNGDQGYIGDGIAEEILRLLSRLSELNVSARTASFYFKGKDADLETIAAKLKVRHLLTGSVQLGENSIRVNAELLDATTGYQLWSKSFNRQMDDIFAIQSEIATAVAEESQVVLSASSTSILAERPTVSPQAYSYYLRGLDYLRQPRTSTVLQNAEQLFDRALAIDADYALALAGQCETQLAVYIRTRSVATVGKAEQVCRKALAIDDSLPEVNTALGYLYWHTGEYDSSETQFRMAIAKNPKHYEAFAGLGDALYSSNQHNPARLAYEQLIELQPAYWRGYQKLGAFYYRQGMDATALPYFQQVTELTPDNGPGWNNLGAVNYMLGHFDAAATAYQQAIRVSPTQSAYVNLGTMYYYFGRYQDAVEMQHNALELAPDDFRIWGRLGAAYLQMDNRAAEAASAFNKGIALANAVISVNPNEPDAQKNIALFYARNNRASESLDALDKAMELAPNDPDTRFFAALTHLALGSPERCMIELERAVSLGYSTKIIASEPALSGLHDSDRYKVLVASNTVGN